MFLLRRCVGVAPPAAAAPLSAQEVLKREVGYAAVDRHVRSGMVVGLGTGSTAYFAVERRTHRTAPAQSSQSPV